MLEKIAMIENRLNEIDEELLTVGSDYERIADLGRERSEIEPVVNAGIEQRRVLEELTGARELAGSDDDEMASLATWMIGDLAVFRDWFWRHRKLRNEWPGEMNYNGDSSSAFVSFRIADIDSDFVVARSAFPYL